MRRGFHLGTVLALLIDDLLPRLQRIIKDDFGLKWDRLFGLGDHGGVLGLRAVLDDALDRFGASLGLGHVSLAVSSGEGSSVRCLAVLAFLDHLGLTRSKIRVRAQGGAERNRLSPFDLVRSRGLLGADLDDLIHRLLGDLLLYGWLAIRIGVGHLLSNGDGLLARLTLGDGLRLTGRHGRVVLDLHAERNLGLNRIGGLALGLAAHTDDLLDRCLGLFLRDDRVAGRLAVDQLLGGGDGLFAFFTLLVYDLLAGL